MVLSQLLVTFLWREKSPAGGITPISTPSAREIRKSVRQNKARFSEINLSFFGGESSSNEDEENPEEETQNIEYEKIDLTNKDIYEIKPDENTNSLVIYNKQQGVVVQEITPNQLSTLVDSLKNPSGILVNKRI